ncbi:MAG: hypothetical protein ABSG03_31565 [Bryobacteraceae bacterium]|jgi:hypothetical protein
MPEITDIAFSSLHEQRREELSDHRAPALKIHIAEQGCNKKYSPVVTPRLCCQSSGSSSPVEPIPKVLIRYRVGDACCSVRKVRNRTLKEGEQ